MNLYLKIKKDKFEAMKSRETRRKNLLDWMMAEAQKKAINSKISHKDPTDEEMINTISSFINSTNGVVEMLVGSGTSIEDEQCVNRLEEIEIAKEYLPQMMSEEELRKEIVNFLSSFDSKEKSVGLIMKFLKENFTGKFDGKMASSIAKTECLKG